MSSWKRAEGAASATSFAGVSYFPKKEKENRKSKYFKNNKMMFHKYLHNIQVSKKLQVLSKIQVFKKVQVFVHKSKVVNCQDSPPPATKDGGTRGGGPQLRLLLGEHKPVRIKPGRIKRATLSLQNQNYCIFVF